MLGNSQFYNRTIRKVVVAFGTLFNDIQLQRYSRDNTTKYEITKVPLSYGPKERYLTAIASDPTLTKTIAVAVPRISFELTGMSYDVSRKQSSTTRNFNIGNDGKLVTQYAPVPYDFQFSMSIYVRNTEDGTQIVEQILPFFTPDFTVTVNLNPDMTQKYDMPIILNSVNTTIDYEGALGDGTTRLIIWDLEFTAKGYIYPPSTKPNGLIGAYSAVSGRYGQANTNIYINTQDRNAQKVYLDMANGVNYFSTGETIRVNNTDATGKVIYFSNSNTGTLIIGELTNLLQPNDIVTGDYTNSVYTVTSVDSSPLKAVHIVVQPAPQDALPDDEYGFAESITEWPNTLLI